MRNSYTILYLAAAWLIAASLWRAWRARRRGGGSLGFHERLRYAAPAILNCVAALEVGLGLVLGSGLFFEGRVRTALLTLAGAMVLGAVLDGAVALKRPLPGKWCAWKLAAPVLAAALGGGLFAFAVYLRSVPGGRAEALRLACPVRGTWRVVTGGRSALTNYHHGNPPAQNCALDLVRLDDESEGAPVYAPLAGLVVEAENERGQGSPEAEGNIVIIRNAEGTEVWLAHLRRGSVRVKKGERVSRGAPVAECGSTGSAESAHLHIHAQRDRRPVPMVFGERGRFLARNDHINAAR
jgi:hypothetical protein